MCNEKKSIVQQGEDFGLCEGCLKFIDSDIQTIQSLDIQPHASLNIPEGQQLNMSRDVPVIPRWTSYGRILQEGFGNQRKTEAVFQRENFRNFSNDFRLVSTGNYRKLTGIHRKKSKKFPTGVLLPYSGDFRYFPVGSEDLSRCFPAGSGGIRWP
jgi:hypothetical protein